MLRPRPRGIRAQAPVRHTFVHQTQGVVAHDSSLSNVWSFPGPFGTLLRMKGAARWIVGSSVVMLALGACRAEDARGAGSSGEETCALQVEFDGVTYNGI